MEGEVKNRHADQVEGQVVLVEGEPLNHRPALAQARHPGARLARWGKGAERGEVRGRGWRGDDAARFIDGQMHSQRRGDDLGKGKEGRARVYSLIFLTSSHCSTVSASLLYMNHEKYLTHPMYGESDLC